MEKYIYKVSFENLSFIFRTVPEIKSHKYDRYNIEKIQVSEFVIVVNLYIIN